MAFRGDVLRSKRTAMREHGRPVSQQRFAQLAGYSKRTQERYETGQSEPRQAHLNRICLLTGEGRDFFFTADPGTSEIATADDEEAARVPPVIQDFYSVLDRMLEERLEKLVEKRVVAVVRELVKS